jgi:hypothetical protein
MLHLLHLLHLRRPKSALFAGALVAGGILGVASCGEELPEVNRQAGDNEAGADGAIGRDGSEGNESDSGAIPDGPLDAPPQSNCGTSTRPIVFVTSGVYPGDQGKPTQTAVELDKLCTSVAHDAGIARSFAAYVRVESAAASVRFPFDPAGYVRPDGTIVYSPGTKPPGSPQVPINVTERCSVLTATEDQLVWTGEGMSTASCERWTKTSPALGNVGSAAIAMSVGWHSGPAVPCTELHHFYCFELP